MTTSWLVLSGLVGLVAAILLASRSSVGQRVFRWLPIPLWCYALPMIAVSLGWLPRDPALYRNVTDGLLPLALALLLLGVNLPSVARTGSRALIAALIGACGIAAASAMWVSWWRASLPSDAWKGAGALAATWTGGSANLLAIRSLLDIPETIFAPLIVVDALVAYSWMALLVAASGQRERIDRWLRAGPIQALTSAPPAGSGTQSARLKDAAAASLIGVGLVGVAHGIAKWLPTGAIVSSTHGWIILLVTTGALIASLSPAVRRVGDSGDAVGYLSLYVVLAAVGAQGRLEALRSAPLWVLIGFGIVLTHGVVLLIAGRFLRLPLSLIATASQANIGGVVSAPLVGAVYHQSLAPVGLLLAMAGNAVGTYLGWGVAVFCRWVVR
jgi:uncharacterized membrane protein